MLLVATELRSSSPRHASIAFIADHQTERINRWNFVIDRYCTESTIKSGKRKELVRAWVRFCVVNDLDPTWANPRQIDEFFRWYQQYRGKSNPYADSTQQNYSVTIRDWLWWWRGLR